MKIDNNLFGKKKYDKVLITVFVIVVAVILVPMLVLRDNYIYTVHDYLDSWPSLFEVLRRGNLFFAPDSPMPVMCGMSTCYLYFDFGIYRCLNFFFGFVWGEIVNKALAILLGYIFMNHMLQFILQDDGRNQRNIKLLALSYAISPVYPNWSISFAVLPLLLELLLRYFKSPEKTISIKMLFFLLFGFFVYFPCIGIFVLAVWFAGFILNLILQKQVNRRLLVSLVLMTVSSVVFNINIFIYVLRGDALNRSLKTFPDYNGLGGLLFHLFKESARFFLCGQYHARPVLTLILPVSLFGIVYLFIHRKELDNPEDKRLFKAGIMILFFISIFSFIRGLDDVGVIPRIFSKVFPILQGFNFGRMGYFNNVLWYILFGIIVIFFSRKKKTKRIFSLLIIAQFVIIICSDHNYQDTRKNLFYKKSLEEDCVTYREFFDEEYFRALKERMDYQYEGTVSVGIEPAVAMYNGFNTLDGYLCINPLTYHDAFRRIIAPALDKSERLLDYYDTWGGRIYVFDESESFSMPVTRNKTMESKKIYINTSAFEKMGGKYILSRYVILNADELGLVLVDDFDGNESIYHIFVYSVE